jgi:sec-independent protein translocase protein TatC
MDNTRVSLIEHLIDLRCAIIVPLMSVAVFCVAGYLVAPEVFLLLKAPLPVQNIVFLGPMDGLMVHLRLAFVVGLIFSSPVIIASSLWFIAPGLTDKEKKLAAYAGAVAVGLFITGICYAYYVALPLVLRVLLTFSTAGMMPYIAVEEYMTFVMGFLINTGLLLEIPLLFFLLMKSGALSAELIARQRRLCILVLTGTTLFFTPGGDLTTQALLALPLYILFEIAVLLARLWTTRGIPRR